MNPAPIKVTKPSKGQLTSFFKKKQNAGSEKQTGGPIPNLDDEIEPAPKLNDFEPPTVESPGQFESLKECELKPLSDQEITIQHQRIELESLKRKLQSLTSMYHDKCEKLKLFESLNDTNKVIIECQQKQISRYSTKVEQLEENLKIAKLAEDNFEDRIRFLFETRVREFSDLESADCTRKMLKIGKYSEPSIELESDDSS